MEAYFVKLNSTVVIDGRTGPWCVLADPALEAGATVSVIRSDNEAVSIRLIREVAYDRNMHRVSPRMWTFERSELSDTHSDDTLHPEDGYPKWWCRLESNGRVFWPRTDDRWVDRDTGVRGRVVKDPRNTRRVGWYTPGSDSGDWMSNREFMDRFVFDHRRLKIADQPVVVSGERPEMV